MTAQERAALEQVEREMGIIIDGHRPDAYRDVMEKWRRTLASLLTPSSLEQGEACNAPTPDRSGRRCNKPRGHDGLHWTYGGNTMSWSAASPSVDGKENTR